MPLYGAQNTTSAHLTAVENSRSRKMSIDKADLKIKYLWKYSLHMCFFFFFFFFWGGGGKYLNKIFVVRQENPSEDHLNNLNEINI